MQIGGIGFWTGRGNQKISAVSKIKFFKITVRISVFIILEKNIRRNFGNFSAEIKRCAFHQGSVIRGVAFKKLFIGKFACFFQNIGNAVVRMRIGSKFLFRVSFRENTAFHFIIGSDGNQKQCAGCVFDFNRFFMRNQFTVFGKHENLSFEKNVIKFHHARKCDFVFGSLNRSRFSHSVAFFHQIRRNERNFGANGHVQCVFSVGSYFCYENLIGITCEMLACITNALKRVFRFGNGAVQGKTAAVILHVGVSEIQITFTEILQSAVSARIEMILVNDGVAKTVFRNLQAFRFSSAEYVDSHISVTERQGPFFPAVVGRTSSVAEEMKIFLTERCFFRIP